jgi:solute:Na+ symporter, SSS family
MNLPFWDLLVFGVYMGGIFLFGLPFYFLKKSSIDFSTGGGNLPAWAIGMSIFATYVSSISFLALPGSAYQSNWNGFVFSLSIPIAALLAVWVFLPKYRNSPSPSAYAYFTDRFGSWAGTYTSAFYLLTQIARMGAILYLLALTMQAQFGWSIAAVIVVTGFVVMLYATLGGLSAVVWTDAIQGLLLIAGAVGCLALLLWKIPGGVSEVLSVGKAEGKFSLGSMELNFGSNTFWMILVYGLFINLQNFGVDQNYIQRYKSASTTREARKSIWLGSLLYVPVSLLFFLIGTCLYVFYQAFPEQLLLPPGQADSVFPYFISNSLPPGLSGLLIAAIFAAGMSSLSTSVNSSATVILENFYKQYFNPQPRENQKMSLLWGASAGMGLLGIAMGLAFNGVESALSLWWALASVFSGGVFGLFVLALTPYSFYRHVLYLAIAAGLFLIAWISIGEGMVFLPELGLHPNMAIVAGTSAICLISLTAGAMLSTKKSSLQ